ncbi:FAD-dependent thymidylate synthase [Kurthia gibsonii]|uniref:FAD-dependent thymidylate synthase n=1 Tax=Kurthia gibsonii TaxID=33946 RepID=UPI0031B6E1CB
MNVTLLAHTQLAIDMKNKIESENDFMSPDFDINTGDLIDEGVTDGQVVALAAIRQCYSRKTAIEVLETESEKYFGERGKEGERLFKQIVSSGHTSTLEHITFTFAVENVSRALLAQLTRHRHISFSVQSQRYVKLSSDSRSGGFDYVVPKTVIGSDKLESIHFGTQELFDEAMKSIQGYYNHLIKLGIPQEDARAVLPNAAATNLVMTLNLRTALEFYAKRKPGNGAQNEITQLAEAIKNEITAVETWTVKFFE